jgi:hypothetical protein
MKAQKRRHNRTPKAIATAKRYAASEACRQSHTRAMRRYRASPKGQLTQWKRELQRDYGLSYSEFQLLLDVQGGVCALCRKASVVRTKAGRLAVDHDHVTNKVRGLLCGKCNMALGLFNDDLATLRRAVEYLARHLPPEGK